MKSLLTKIKADKIMSVSIVLLAAVILALSIRGNYGNPTSEVINDTHWTIDGPLELSPDRGRFALALSLIEDNSFFFSIPIARFATPDLGYHNGNYVSLFAPGISFLIIPGYFVGEVFNAAQVGSFAVISLFALLNLILIRALAVQMGASKRGATLGALTFLFATPAFAYGVSLYQHHVTTFILLVSAYILAKSEKLSALFFVWILLAASLTIDYPNFFLVLPLSIYAGWRIFNIKTTKKGAEINFKPLGLLTLLPVILPMMFFFWFNEQSYGDKFQLAGTVGSVKAIDENGLPTTPEVETTEDLSKLTNPETQNKSAVGFFKTRNMLNGFYTHILSKDRGIITYTPIMFLGFVGLYYMLKGRDSISKVLFATILMNIVVYSLWGDPWGGWAFGSRYLIPSYAFLAVYIAFLLDKFGKKELFLAGFLLLFGYSAFVNTAGALASNRNPPKVEVLNLERLSGIEEKFTPERAIDMIANEDSKSFVFRTYAHKHMSAKDYFMLVFGSISIVTTIIVAGYRKEEVASESK